MVSRNYAVGGRPRRSRHGNREIRMPVSPARQFPHNQFLGNQYHTTEISGAAGPQARRRRSASIRTAVIVNKVEIVGPKKDLKKRGREQTSNLARGGSSIDAGNRNREVKTEIPL